jgi:hypothetical protein
MAGFAADQLIDRDVGFAKPLLDPGHRLFFAGSPG